MFKNQTTSEEDIKNNIFNSFRYINRFVSDFLIELEIAEGFLITWHEIELREQRIK